MPLQKRQSEGRGVRIDSELNKVGQTAPQGLNPQQGTAKCVDRGPTNRIILLIFNPCSTLAPAGNNAQSCGHLGQIMPTAHARGAYSMFCIVDVFFIA